KWEIKYDINNDTSVYTWADATNGKGVIYYMKDEFGNEAGYDFKNILFSFGEPNYYTFSAYDEDGNLIDASLDKKENVHNNVIKPYYDFTGARYVLNRIYFKGSTVYNNTFGNDCQDIVFEANKDEESEEYNYSNAINNTFGSMCKHNKFGYNCQNNTFGSICTNNTIGNLFQNNLFKNNCSYNTFENDKNTTCHINNTFASGITGLTVNRVLFAYNHITSNIDSITVSRALTNSILTNGVVFEPTIQYEMDDIDWNLNQTFSVGGEAQGILMAHNGFANIPNNQITWKTTGSDTELGASIIDPTPETPDEPYKVQIKPTEGDKEFDLKITATINGTTEITRTFTIDVLGINLTDWSTVINKGRTSTTTVEVEGKTVTNVSVSTDPTKTAVEFGTPSVTQPDQISITPEGSGLNLPFTITVTCNDTETGENLDLTCTFHFDIHNYQINTDDILAELTLNGDLQYYEDSGGTPVTMTSSVAKVICKDGAALEQERTATPYKVTLTDPSETEEILGLNVLSTGNEFTVTPKANGKLPLHVKVTDLYNDSLILVEQDIIIPVHHYVIDNDITIEDVTNPGVEVLPSDLVTNKTYKTSAISITDVIPDAGTVVPADKIANWNVTALGSLIENIKAVTEETTPGVFETHIEFSTHPYASGEDTIEIGASLITGTEISPIT
ncbi:MAG: hypothetical protein HUJ52_03375, partial [Malacoplasma sp.]|nr:hypothetical protein [Malacoplasma sp.]